MNPLRVTATNYRTFERLDVDLPTGTVAIVGENGAGKSSILNVVDVALFAERGELAPLLTVGEEDLELLLEFEHAGELYRVRRQFSGRGRGKTTCDFERRTVYAPEHDGATGGFEWESLTRENVEATSALIANTLGLSRTTFRASSFLRQGDGAAFTEAQPRDRKAILAEILNLSLWDRLLDRARADLRGCEDDLIKSRALIDGCAELVETKPLVERVIADSSARLQVARTSLADGEAQYEEAQRKLAAAAVLAEQVRTAEADLQAARAEHERTVAAFSEATEAAHRLADKKIELDDVAADADRVPALEQQVAQLREAATAAANAMLERRQIEDDAERRRVARDRMVDQALALHDDARVMRGKADHLEQHIDESADCDRCGQKLGAEAAARAAESYRADALKLDQQAAEIDTNADADLEAIAGLREQAALIVVPEIEDPGPVERDLVAARRAAEQKASLVEQVRQLTEQAAQREQLQAHVVATAAFVDGKQVALDKAKEGVVDETALQAHVSRWRIAIHEARGLIETRQADLVRAQAQLDLITVAERQLAEHHNLIAITQARVDVLKLAEKAYGRDGIPALILESSAVPWIEAEGNRILSELGTPYRVELRTQSENKTNANLRETLDVIVNDGTNIRPYETFSGGEKTRINLALRLALAGLLANRRGAQSRLLAIDELDGLDAAGMEALVRVLNGLSGSFDRVMVVSHQPQLATAFDQVIEVERGDGGRSRIVGALEAVAA